MAAEATAPAGTLADGPASESGGWLALHATVAAFLVLTCTVIWVSAGAGTFWPIWPAVGLASSVALHLVALRFRVRPRTPGGWLVCQAEVSGLVVGTQAAVWLAAGADDDFWPGWSAIGFGLLLGLHALVLGRDRLPGAERERALVERVGSLEATRRGALDVQAAELRRIERDLHDGAQVRLVALTMQLGRAEARLKGHPEAAGLVRAARQEATAAIAELRDLARGIAPPILADRGLLAAVSSLAERAPVPVAVDGRLGARRPVPVIETAAYFVVAEALTNVAKHAPRASASVELVQDDGVLRVVVTDDGPGGAVATGSGLSGLRQRLAALDGALRVDSPPAGGTVLTAELPCAS